MLQQQNNESRKPVDYWSYSLNGPEKNYSTTKRESYAVVWAMMTLRPYIEGTTIAVRTDHESLKWLLSLTESSGGLTR